MKLFKEFERIITIDRLGDRITDFNPTEGDSYGALRYRSQL
ncbi:hypothetical protein [Dolichospermum flos-aquae]|nr:hypothetical protein [Dolichospermum flos-aquae]